MNRSQGIRHTNQAHNKAVLLIELYRICEGVERDMTKDFGKTIISDDWCREFFLESINDVKVPNFRRIK